MENYLIIGGGIAGLNLAIELEKKGISYTLFESSSTLGGQLINLYPEKDIVDIPGISQIKSKDYVSSLLEKVNKSNIKLNTEIVEIKEENNQVNIKSKSNEEFIGTYLVIATGLGQYKPRPLGVENEDKYSNILFSLKDYSFLKGKSISIFGGGDSALDWAKQLSNFCSTVNLIHRRTEFRGNPETIKGCPINLFLPYVPSSLIEKDNKCKGIVIEEVNSKERKEILSDYILVTYGSIPVTSYFDLPSGPTMGILVSPTSNKVEGKNRIYVLGDASSYEGKIKRIAPALKEINNLINNI